MDPLQTEHQQMKELIAENKRLLTENNQILKKMQRLAKWSFWFRVVTFLVFIGAPFIIYYWLLEPYFTNLGSSFDTFEAGLQEIPGWKQFYQAIGGQAE